MGTESGAEVVQEELGIPGWVLGVGDQEGKPRIRRGKGLSPTTCAGSRKTWTQEGKHFTAKRGRWSEGAQRLMRAS